MRFHKILSSLILSMLLFGLVTTVKADPPKPQVSPTSTGSVQPDNGFPSVAQPSGDILDPATASVTHKQLEGDQSSVAPVAPSPGVSSPNSTNNNGDPFAPGPILATQLVDGEFKTITDPAESTSSLIIDPIVQTERELGAAASTLITLETFEGTFNPPTTPPGWSRIGSPTWDDVDCFPVDGAIGGIRSAWAANLTGLNPCGVTPDDYPANMDAWLIYGPFDLSDAQSASLDFFYRLDSEQNDDLFKWLASTDGTNFSGWQISGTFASGPFPNGYNFESFDLTTIPTLGDVTGQANVWIAFRFQSDADANTGAGAFIDFIRLRKNTDPRTYITDENFDVDEFPNALWDSFDNDGPANGEYRWDDVSDFFQGPSCPPRSGDWSMWPADEGANGLDPCSNLAPDNYPNNADSWLVHGPFDLTGASEAWVDFYFRNVSETTNDTLGWFASTDGVDFYGFETSGTFTGGPNNNGYNLMRFDLSNVGGPVNDLRGEPVVWLAFIFTSNGSITAQGPFIDDVSIVVERPSAAGSATYQVYLPTLYKSTSIPASVFVTNFTGGNLSYKIFGTSAGTISCTVPNNAQDFFCDKSFDAGAFNWQATATCGSKTGTKFFSEGQNYPTPFQCN